MRSRAYSHIADWCAPALLIALLLLVIASLFMTRAGVYVQEDLMMALAPTPDRVARYGERHLDATVSGEYDIDRSQYFYMKLATMDPSYHYLNHQLARIEFLRGNFNTAMLYINKQIALEGTTTPNSYYIRGLIEGYMGKYDDAANDYAYYLTFDPHDWAALNDYTWALLKAQRFHDADIVTAKALLQFPDNPWLLNSRATALYELHDYADAYKNAQKASETVQKVSLAGWSHSYPGNDPRSAPEGLRTFKDAITANVHIISLALATGTVQ